MAMMAYLTICGDTYIDDIKIMVTLNKMSKGRGATFVKGWYHKIFDKDLPKELKTFKRLSADFH